MGSKKLLLIIDNIMSTFVEDHWLDRNEICLKARANFLEPILSNNMVCLSIFGGGVVIYVCLICLFVCFCFCPFCILLIFSSVKSYFVENARKKL
jgi:hypothetical protein